MEGTYGVIEELPLDVKRKVACDNAKRIYHLE